MSAEPQPTPIMRQLWQRMAEIYGHRWTSAYGEDAGVGAGQTWAKGLAGLVPAQIAMGLQSALVSADEWPPSLPAFRALCFGIPSIEAVRAAFDGRSKPTPFARLTWSFVDSYRYRMADANKAGSLLKAAYELARGHVMRGGKLPGECETIAAPEPPTRTPASPETAAASLKAMADGLRLQEDDEPDPGTEMRLEERV